MTSRHFFRRTVPSLTALAAVALAVPAAQAAGTDTRTLERQIQELQHTVHVLQQRVDRLEAHRPPAAPPAAAAATAPAPAAAAAPNAPARVARVPDGAALLTPEIKENWRNLKQGMDAEQVRHLIGTPSRMLDFSGQRVWYYYYEGVGGGSVMFGPDGSLAQWQHPPFGSLW